MTYSATENDVYRCAKGYRGKSLTELDLLRAQCKDYETLLRWLRAWDQAEGKEIGGLGEKGQAIVAGILRRVECRTLAKLFIWGEGSEQRFKKLEKRNANGDGNEHE